MRSAVWGGVDYAVTQPFNPAVHTGIDIGCPSGTTIYAARAGVVERVQTGMTSVHVTGSIQRDFYLHGTSLVSVGQVVQQGQPVIKSDTVQVDPRYPLTGPHLHFEVQNGYTLPGAPPSAPEAPLDPVPVLLAAQAFGAAAQAITTQEGDDMVFIGPIHKLASPVTLRAFTNGSYYRAPINDPRLIGGVVKEGGMITVDYWRYVSTPWVSPDVSGTAGAQPGQDSVVWHATTGGFVPDAILDTSKLAGAPAPAIPATEALDLYFAAREDVATTSVDDDSALSSAVQAAQSAATAAQAAAAKVESAVTKAAAELASA